MCAGNPGGVSCTIEIHLFPELLEVPETEPACRKFGKPEVLYRSGTALFTSAGPETAGAADPAAQTAATEQTPSGINVQAQDATYYAVEGVNLRSDANAEAEFVAGVLSGESLKCTGVCDNGWIRVDYNGQTCYASGDYVSTTPPVGAVAADTTAEDTTAEAAQ